MSKNFRELQAKMSTQHRARAAARAKVAMTEMLLAELRQLSGRTQSDLASALGIKQPTLSRLESQDDMQISTLRRIIEALGGELEIIAKLPSGSVSINQFRDESSLQRA
jgi:transcriptional regulator with XRE-family HTH domain